MPKTKRSSRASNPTVTKTDAEYDLADWMALNHAALVLKCEQFQLVSKGKKEVLAKRLLERFSSNTANDSTSTDPPKENADPNTGTSPASSVSMAIAAIQEQQRMQQLENMKIQESLLQLLNASPQITAANPITTTPLTSVPQNPLVIGEASATPTPTGESTTTLSTYNPTVAIQPNPIHFQVGPDATTTATTGASTNLAAVHGFNSHQHLTTGITANNPSPDVLATNPYVPPPITTSLTAKIKKLEYVDLGEVLASILPNAANIGAYTGTGGDDGEDYCLSQAQTPGTPLTFKKRSTRSPISNLASWCAAWNTFYEATLHYFPSMHHQLFCYFKHIIQYATNHKFTFLMAYDKTARLQIAAQRHLPPSLQTTSWTKHCNSLYNTYLRDNMKPQCSKCSAHDHFSNKCPKTNQQPISLQPQQYWHTSPPQPPQQPTTPIQTTGQFRNASQQNQSLPASLSNVRSNNRADDIVCFRFNRGESCRLPCRYPHICRKCRRPDCTAISCKY